jgi:zinc protease
MDEGAGNLDSQTFQRTLEDKSIRLRFDAGLDTFGGRLQTLVKHKALAFRLLRLALTEPRFDEEPVERIRMQILVGLRRDEESPHTIAGRTLRRALFGAHPYGRPVDGTQASVQAISRDDLAEFVRARIARDNLVIGIVGDISAEALGPLLDETFGKLPAKAGPWKLDELSPATDGRTMVVEKNYPQSAIMFADKGLKREHPDFYAAYVMNYILGGGGFTSRLYSEIREKRGLAYSVSTGLSPMDASAYLAGGAGTANARVKETLDILRAEWTRMASGGATEKELNDAKTYLTGAFPLRFSASSRIAGILVGMQIARLGIDYLDRRNSLIDAVTQADVARVAKNLLDPKRLTMVVVGKPAGVKSTP